ncbi:hypothetical protein [Hoylesella oralis]|uniref:hypothetical protein n=1 Tax=Hoylesella oralis TaxID=28134 RepID=UPI0028EEBB7C|nr:hypothetical protein [Hoylesella oralis]
MDILKSPDALSLCGNIKHFVISSEREVYFALKDMPTGGTIVEHTYTPSNIGRIEVDVRDIILPLLSFDLRNVLEPYRQPDIVRTFEVVIQAAGLSAPQEQPYRKEFTVIRSGVDELAETADSFLKQNFLTWQPNVKAVTYYTPEYLTYYAIAAVTVKCKAHLDTEDKEIVLAQFGGGECWTIPVPYAVISGKVGALPQYYDIWVENADGERLTYIQRYYASDMRSEAEAWILFENSLGGIDTFRAYGESENTAEHTHNVAEIEEVAEEYRVDTTRKFKKNTGFLNKKERIWLLDFFPSLAKYIYTASHLRRIVVTESDVDYQALELPTNYNFTYKFADAKPYLNIPRIDKPLEVLSIKVPDVGSFTVAPRLAEFPALPLSEGALFPVQDPYSEAWNTTTAGALASFIVKIIASAYKGGGAIGHTHPNMSVLDALSFMGDYLLKNAKKISAGFADTAGTADTLAALSDDWKKILRKDIPDAASKLITFFEGIGFGDDGRYSIDGQGIADLAGAVVSDFLKSSNYNASAQKGFGFDADGRGGYRLSIKDLLVWGKATFHNLELRTMSYVAGNYRISGAGSKIAYVRWMDKNGKTTQDISQTVAFRCYILADDGTMATRNFWEVDDQAKAEEFNIEPGVYQDVANRQYWRKVIAVSADNAAIMSDDGADLFPGKKFAWIDLSKGDCTDMVRKADDPVRDDYPKAGDSIVQSGNRTKPSRQGFIDINSTGEHGAGIVIYKDVNSYTLDGKIVGDMSKDGFLFESRFFRLITSSGTVPLPVDLGEWYRGMKCEYYNRVSHLGSLWLCIAPEGVVVTEEPKDGSAVWQKQVSRGEKGDKGEAAIELHLDIIRGDMFYREGQGFVAELKATVIQGGKDLTPTLHTSQLVWTRESEDAEGNEEWNARHRGIGDSVTITTDDLTEVTAVVFTLYNKDGTLSASEAVTF